MYASCRSLRTAALMVAALVSTAPLAAQDVNLRYRWTKGEELKYRSTIQTDMQMSGLPGMGDMNVAMTMVQMSRMIVDDVAPDGTATLRNAYDSVKMTMSIPMMGDVTYDSAAPPKPGENPIADTVGKSVGAMVGETITMVVGPTGKVVKIDGLSRIAEKVKAATPSAGGAMGMGNMDQLFSEDGQRSAIEQTFAWMPDKPVRAGDTWKNEFKVPSPLGTQITSVVNTLKGSDAVTGSSVVRVASTGTIKSSGAPGTMGPMTVTMGEGQSTGETLFDTKLGRVRKSVGTVTQPMSMRMSAPDGTDIAIQAVQKTTSTMDLVEK